MHLWDLVNCIPVSDELLVFVSCEFVFLCDISLEMLFEKPLSLCINKDKFTSSRCAHFAGGNIFVQSDHNVFLFDFREALCCLERKYVKTGSFYGKLLISNKDLDSAIFAYKENEVVELAKARGMGYMLSWAGFAFRCYIGNEITKIVDGYMEEVIC